MASRKLSFGHLFALTLYSSGKQVAGYSHSIIFSCHPVTIFVHTFFSIRNQFWTSVVGILIEFFNCTHNWTKGQNWKLAANKLCTISTLPICKLTIILFKFTDTIHLLLSSKNNMFSTLQRNSKNVTKKSYFWHMSRGDIKILNQYPISILTYFKYCAKCRHFSCSPFLGMA